MDDKNKKHKLTFKNIVFLSIFGLLIIVLKYYFTRSDACRDNCININSELDVIRCLDACAINSEEFLEPVSYTKIIYFNEYTSMAPFSIKLLHQASFQFYPHFPVAYTRRIVHSVL